MIVILESIEVAVLLKSCDKASSIIIISDSSSIIDVAKDIDASVPRNVVL